MKINNRNKRIFSVFLLIILNLNLCESAALILIGIENHNTNFIIIKDHCEEDLIKDDCIPEEFIPIKTKNNSKKSVKSIKVKTDKLDHGGPSMPEASSFTSPNSNNLVNLATGDFNYSIPLLDVGGYPLAINYNSNVGVNDEASWVGLGWSLNAGSVNRTVRGLPDDFKAVDISKEAKIKEKKTIGIGIGFGVQISGISIGKGGKAGIGLSLGQELEYDNYEGFSTTLGIGGNARFGGSNFGGGIGLDLSLSSSKGATFSPSLSLSGNFSTASTQTSVGGFLGMTLDSREGFKSLNFGINSNSSITGRTGHGESERETDHELPGMCSNFRYSFAAPTASPPFEIPITNVSISTKGTLGGEIKPVHLHGEVEHNLHLQLVTKKFKKKSFGYLYSQFGGEDALHDFNRANEGVYFRETPTLPITAYTFDLYNVSAYGLDASFRPKRNDVGTLHQAKQVNKSITGETAAEVGFGDLVHIGTDIIYQEGSDVNQKWANGNPLAQVFQFSDSMSNPAYEPVYFQNTGELTPMEDEAIFNKLGGFDAVRPQLERDNDLSTANTSDVLSNGQELQQKEDVTFTERRTRNKMMSYRTRAEVRHAGESLEAHYLNATRTGHYADPILEGITTSDDLIQDIKVTDEGGLQYHFGLPAYNNFIQEMSFMVDDETTSVEEDDNGNVRYNLIDASIENTKGENNYFLKTTTPKHAYAWYITKILSSDYVDVSNNGPTQDDLGSFTSFQYKKVHSNYLWRNPQQDSVANFQEGELHTKRDNSASIIFGAKEVYYLDKIQTRNYVAEFFTSPRKDGLGTKGIHGGTNPYADLHKLDSIKLFAAFSDNTTGLIPIKTIYLNYDYSLCKNNPTTINRENPIENGKLTLKSISFSYGNSNKAKESPFVFAYTNNPEYHQKKVDRWGNYTRIKHNNTPYVNQDAMQQNEDASAWLLDSIKTPQNAAMKVYYESDDYAHVQDQKSMVMYKIAGVMCSNLDREIDTRQLCNCIAGADKKPAKYLVINIPRQASIRLTTNEDVFELFKDIDELYFKAEIEIYESHYEEVQGFIPIDFRRSEAGVKYGLKANPSAVGDYQVWIRIPVVYHGAEIEYEENYHPIKYNLHPFTLAAREYIMIDKPILIKPGDHTSPTSIEEAFDDLGQTFDEVFGSGGLIGYLQRKKRGLRFRAENSYVRLYPKQKYKFGGGSRVKMIAINDNWDKMQHIEDHGQKNAIYATKYIYHENNVSTGVASYEPMIGKEENALVKPVNYSRRKVNSITINNHQLEPFGDIFYPAPSVVYSKVKLMSSVPYNVTQHGTGYSIHEFYTAKDFPCKYSKTDKYFIGKEFMVPLQFYNRSELAEVVVQGFAVEVNDMHGKQKMQSEYDQFDHLITSTENIYKTNSSGDLDNFATIINPESLQLQNRMIGVNHEVIVDACNQITSQEGGGVQLNIEVFTSPAIPFPIFIPIPIINQFFTEFRSMTITKFITRMGLLDRVITRKFGSVVENKNMAYDEGTGRVIVTQFDNEFENKKYYNIDLPAYWAYPGMGHVSANEGMKIWSKRISDGKLQLGNLRNLLFEGDVLILSEVNSSDLSHKVWVSEVNEREAWLINDGGEIFRGDGIYNITIERSGRENLLSASVGSIITTNNPLTTRTLNLNPSEVLNATASTYSDYWHTDKAFVRRVTGGDCECTIQSPLEKVQPRSNILTINLDLRKRSEDFIVFPNRIELLFPSRSCSINISTQDGSIFCDSTLRIEFKMPEGSDRECRNGNTLVGTSLCGQGRTQTFIMTTDCIDLVSCRSSRPSISIECNSGGGNLNPFLNGIIGNYRPEQNYFIHTKRTEGRINESGYLESFEPFWLKDRRNGISINSNKTLWENGDKITKVNSRGNPIEVKNALDIPSANIYTFGNSLMTVNAINANLSDLAYDGFEDYSTVFYSRYSFDRSTFCRIPEHFKLDGTTDIDPVGLDMTVSHTGNKSVRLNVGGEVKYTYSSNRDRTRPERNNRMTNGVFRLEDGDINPGFSPDPNKEYYLSAWVHANDRDRSSFEDLAEININGSAYTANGAIIDGWQQISGTFRFTGREFVMKLKNSSNKQVWFDDVRIHPFHSNMESYVYTPEQYRLRAKLDQNNYASFYDYDAEGKLSREKRETELGVYTIKEIRSELPK
jgi:hypothetical protein